MKYQRILVPFDGSDHAEGAFTTARELALQSETAEIFVVNIVPMALASSLTAGTDPITGGSSAFIDQEGYAAMVDTALENIKKEIDEVVDPLLDGMPSAFIPKLLPTLLRLAEAPNTQAITTAI